MAPSPTRFFRAPPTGFAFSAGVALRGLLTGALRTAASGRAHLFIDMIVSEVVGVNTLGWITGTGKETNPLTQGNSTRYICRDGTHPTSAGYAYMGHRVAQAISAQIVTPEGLS